MNTVARFSFSQIDPDWERPTPPAASLRRDVLVWLVVLAATLLLNTAYHSAGFLGDDAQQIHYSYWAAAAMTLPLIFRRVYPLSMMLLATALFFALSYVSEIAPATLSYQLCYFAVLYAGIAWGKNRTMTWIVYALVCTAALIWIVLAWVVTDSAYSMAGVEEYSGGPFSQATAGYVMAFVTNLFYYGCAALMGRTAWNQAYQRTVLAAQAQQLERQAEQMAQDAVTRDRLRIARELHDSVGHHVSSMGIQAAAARRALKKKPELAAEPLANIEKLARSSVSEMKNLIRVMRAAGEAEHGGGSVKEPQVAEIFDLVEHMSSVGVQTRLQVGEQDLARLTHLHQGTQLSIYRMAQEALTNVRKHSAAQNAVLALRTGGSPGAHWAELEVTDDGPATGPERGEGQEYIPDPSRHGYGLQGIRERAAALGGTCWTGRRRGAPGWKVQVRFPIDIDETHDAHASRSTP
ncbi:sensor histidine kinase [Rothia nasimurium]|uniref:sensor histidine kinase n=1 Tax=Rothia nasimurium TaxID=85336 RepID=UPI001F257C4F|nr:sensor histidine kinase [Rothia nasimurium]